MGKLTSIYLMQ